MLFLCAVLHVSYPFLLCDVENIININSAKCCFPRSLWNSLKFTSLMWNWNELADNARIWEIGGCIFKNYDCRVAAGNRIVFRRFDCARRSFVCQNIIYDRISTRVVLKSIMNERNVLHVRLAFSCTRSLRFPFWDYKGHARKLILPELPHSLKRTALHLCMNYRL